MQGKSVCNIATPAAANCPRCSSARCRAPQAAGYTHMASGSEATCGGVVLANYSRGAPAEGCSFDPAVPVPAVGPTDVRVAMRFSPIK